MNKIIVSGGGDEPYFTRTEDGSSWSTGHTLTDAIGTIVSGNARDFGILIEINQETLDACARS